MREIAARSLARSQSAGNVHRSIGDDRYEVHSRDKVQVREGHSPVIPGDASRFADVQRDRARHIPKPRAEGSSGNDEKFGRGNKMQRPGRRLAAD